MTQVGPAGRPDIARPELVGPLYVVARLTPSGELWVTRPASWLSARQAAALAGISRRAWAAAAVPPDDVSGRWPRWSRTSVRRFIHRRDKAARLTARSRKVS